MGQNESYEHMLEDYYVLDFMPKDHLQSFYHYSGSLTQPNCSHVLWYVMEHDVHIPKDLVHEFEHLTNITMNSRDLQRVITERFTRMTTMMNLWLEMEVQPFLLYPISHCSSLLP